MGCGGGGGGIILFARREGGLLFGSGVQTDIDRCSLLYALNHSKIVLSYICYSSVYIDVLIYPPNNSTLPARRIVSLNFQD